MCREQKDQWISRVMRSGKSQKSALKHSKNSTDTTGFKITNFWMNNKEIIGFVFCVIWRIIQIPECVIFPSLIECCLYWQERGPHFKSSAEYTYLDRLTLWSFLRAVFVKYIPKLIPNVFGMCLFLSSLTKVLHLVAILSLLPPNLFPSLSPL